MKRIILSTAAIAIFVGFIALPKSTWGQASGSQPAAPAAATVPHKVGLIDMAHVFKEYDKFKILREELKSAIEQEEAKAKQIAERMQGLQQEMQTFNNGSQDYVSREKQILDLKAQLEALKLSAQREFVKREAGIYKTVYSEVEDAIKLYADWYHYTLIIRFTRDDLPDQSDPRGVITGMNRQVVFWRKEDDITDSILNYLNKNYSSAASATIPATAPRR